jgi:hypothetical protein
VTDADDENCTPPSPDGDAPRPLGGELILTATADVLRPANPDPEDEE